MDQTPEPAGANDRTGSVAPIRRGDANDPHESQTRKYAPRPSTLHAFDWTRDEAIEYTVNHSGLTRADVTAEVDRYLVWPGQATAHKIGELKTKVCVRRQSKLGERFDLRRFHNAVSIAVGDESNDRSTTHRCPWSPTDGHIRSSRQLDTCLASARFQTPAVIGSQPFALDHSPKQSRTVFATLVGDERGSNVPSSNSRTVTTDPSETPDEVR